jgi:phospholipid/cholesterol/gamma-HCH transport system substrate-binding protein
METRAAYVAVGGFVLALVGGLVIAALWFAHGQLVRAQTRYDIYFASVVSGLVEGSPVQISGVQVGRVIAVALDPKDPQRVRVTIEVAADAPIRSDSVASIEMQALTGGAWVAITPGTYAAPPIETIDEQNYAVIWSRDSDIQRVVATIPQLLAKLTDLTDRVASVLDDKNQASLAATLDNLRQFSASLAASSGNLDRLFADSAADAKELRQTIASMTAAVQRADVAIQRIDGVAADTSTTLRDVDKLVKDNQAPLRDFTQNGLGEFRQLVGRTESLITAMTRAADALERDPSSLIYGDRRQGYRPQ